MNFRWLAVGVAVGVVASLVPSCGQEACGPTTCFGCCDLAGLCQSGTDLEACGTAGGSCNSCSANQVCQVGECLLVLDTTNGSDAGTDAGVPVAPTNPLSFTASIAPNPAVVGSNTMTVTIAGANGVAVTGAALTARTFMPAMGHGSPTPTVTETGNGGYKVSSVRFTMSGVWQVTLTATCAGGLSGSKVFNYTVN